jgi:hypothetical protein
MKKYHRVTDGVESTVESVRIVARAEHALRHGLTAEHVKYDLACALVEKLIEEGLVVVESREIPGSAAMCDRIESSATLEVLPPEGWKRR